MEIREECQEKRKEIMCVGGGISGRKIQEWKHVEDGEKKRQSGRKGESKDRWKRREEENKVQSGRMRGS